MSSAKKIILGTLTLLPWVTMALFFVFIFSTMHGGASHDPELFKFAMGAHFVGVFASLGTMVYYVVHALKYNDSLKDQNTRLLWALLLFFGNMMATPIYFFMHILPEREAMPAGRGTIDPRDGMA